MLSELHGNISGFGTTFKDNGCEMWLRVPVRNRRAFETFALIRRFKQNCITNPNRSHATSIWRFANACVHQPVVITCNTGPGNREVSNDQLTFNRVSRRTIQFADATWKTATPRTRSRLEKLDRWHVGLSITDTFTLPTDGKVAVLWREI